MASPALMVSTPRGVAVVRDARVARARSRMRSTAIVPGRERLLGEDAQELLAAVAVERVAAAGLGLELGRHRLQHLVAGLVAVGVVVGLEVIDVEQRHAVPVAVAGHSGLEQLEILLQRPAVAESGQRVAPGDVGELVVEPLQLDALVGSAGGAAT